MTTDQRASDEFADLAELMRDEMPEPDAAAQAELRALRRRRRRRALLVTAAVITVLLLAVGGYTGWALSAPLAAPVMTVKAPAVVPASAAVIAMPAQGASAISVSGGDAYLGPTASGIWTTSGTDEPRPLASLTKLITALVILDAKPLAHGTDPGPTITFSAADNDLYDEYYVMGATIAEMPTGSAMTQRQALATMLVPSASNYAEAVSTWAFGSQGRFVEAARAWLAAHGLTGTTIVEPTGMSARNTSTLTDLIAIGKLAAADPTIALIAATPSLSFDGYDQMFNTNALLGTGGITGLKTGNLGPGTHNLLYSARVDVEVEPGVAERLSVIGVVLGGASRESVNADVLAQLDSIRAGFHGVRLAERGQLVGSVETRWGATAELVLARGASIFTWSDTEIIVDLDTTVPATYADGEVAGFITWTAGPHTETADIIVKGAIEPPTAWWRLTHPGELGGE
jgi:D-alanyl-D-alanine carboxypeptidase (penicillin-binding protein 5/6)